MVVTATGATSGATKDHTITVTLPALTGVTFTADKGTLGGSGQALTLTTAASGGAVTLTPTAVPQYAAVGVPSAIASSTPATATAAAGTGAGNTSKLVITPAGAAGATTNITATYGGKVYTIAVTLS